MKKIIAFLPKAFEDFSQCSAEDQKICAKIVELIRNIERHPFSGLGKPEPLRHDLKGLWSRRITQKHRLVYKVAEEEIIIVSCKFHYR